MKGPNKVDVVLLHGMGDIAFGVLGYDLEELTCEIAPVMTDPQEALLVEFNNKGKRSGLYGFVETSLVTTIPIWWIRELECTARKVKQIKTWNPPEK